MRHLFAMPTPDLSYFLFIKANLEFYYLMYLYMFNSRNARETKNMSHCSKCAVNGEEEVI